MHTKLMTAVAVLLTSAMAMPVAAAVQVDQANYQFNTGIPWGFDFGNGNVQPNVGVSQSYTAGLKGRLDSINLYCNGICSIDQLGNTLSLSLYQGNSLLKTVQTSTVNAPFLGGELDMVNLPGFSFIKFDFAGKGVSQLAGQSYRWVLDSITGPGDIKGRGGLAMIGNPLAGGSGYAGDAYGSGFPENDMVFNTKVLVGSVPEPASWAMLISGFGLAGALQRRRRLLTA
jgi:hypothetical protein